MEFWTEHLKDSEHSWIVSHSIWERLRGKKKDEQYEEYFFEDDEKRGFIILQINKWCSDENNIIYFAYTIEQYRNRGVLKQLVKKLKDYDHIIAEVKPDSYQEKVWEKLGFSFYRTYKPFFTESNLLRN